MRDPNRIKPLLKSFEELWQKCPDMRLGQLVINVAEYSGFGNNMLIAEDDDWKNAIDNFDKALTKSV